MNLQNRPTSTEPASTGSDLKSPDSRQHAGDDGPLQSRLKRAALGGDRSGGL
ncbi:MAG: hypothetical protein MZU95_16515 [Desulfomicrobium escambiense]|nr:hypothetical protein [Desulfomicrobium escambiense]